MTRIVFLGTPDAAIPALATLTREFDVGLVLTQPGFPIRTSSAITLAWQLPEAYRSLLRPSSAPSAKASTVGS